MSKKAQEYLDKCRVIGPTEVREGIVVSSSLFSDFKVSIITIRNGNINEKVIEEFGLSDFSDENNDKMILNFKKLMTDIVGRRKYYVETGVYNFLANIDSDIDDFEDEDYFENAVERAEREAADEEEAEENFDRYLKALEEM